MNTVLIVLKKELRRYFTDTRMIIGLLLPGVLIFCLYSLMGQFMTENMTETATDFNICIANSPDEFNSFQTVEGWTIEVKSETDEEIIFDQISNKYLDLYIVYDENFYQEMSAYTPSSGSLPPQVKIYYNSTSTASSTIYQYYVSVLNEFESSITNKFDINYGEGQYDLAKSEDVTMKIMTMMLPFLLIIFLFSGCMSICAESIAGEKERGTIATLLITPAKRSHIAIGKLLALSITSLVSSSASFLGLILSLPNLIGSDSATLSVYTPANYMCLFIVIVSTVFIFVVILTSISTIAKSVKEASSYAVIVNVLIMLLGVTNFMGTEAATNPLLYLIPAYNSIQSLTAILGGNIDILCFMIMIVSNLVYTGIGVYVITKMFNSEKVMFNK